MSQVTGLVLTYNEEPNIRRTLESLQWLARIIVIDSFSRDATAEIARSFSNVELHQRNFDSHAVQWNFGLDLIETEWALTLDADYFISAELTEEIGKKLQSRKEKGKSRKEEAGNPAGYYASFRYCIDGKPLRASIYPPRIVLFQTELWRYVDEGHTQQLRFLENAAALPHVAEAGSFPGGAGDIAFERGIGKLAASPTEDGTGRVKKLRAKIDHDDRKPLSRWIASQDRYARLEAEYLVNEKVEGRKEKKERAERLEAETLRSEVGDQRSEVRSKKAQITGLNFQDKLRKMIFVAPLLMPVYLLLARGLILDGWRGWYYVFQRTIAELLLSLRLIEQKFVEG